jgi:hypothetical protein
LSDPVDRGTIVPCGSGFLKFSKHDPQPRQMAV